jgi:DNA-binding FadR family transcriptional regulator
MIGDPEEADVSLRTAQRASLVDQVIDQLKEQISSGSWQMHAKIPTETMLAEHLGVGRNTVREAVRALTHAGLLECRQGDGTYVRATSELSGAMARRLRTAEHIEILEVRRAFEVEAARLAATRRTDKDIALIEAALAEREKAWANGDPDTFVDNDLAFHVTVVEATHNRVLIDLYLDFSAALRASIAAAGGSLEQNYIPHEAIVRAIVAGDAAAAERAGHACMEHILIALTEAPDLVS